MPINRTEAALASRYIDTVSRVFQLLLSALPFRYGLSLLFRRPLPLEKLQCLLVPFVLAMNGTRVGVVVFEGRDDERSIFVWHVEFHAFSLASPPPQFPPGLDELLYGLWGRNPLALNPTFFPGFVIEIANSVFTEPGQVLAQLLKLIFSQRTFGLHTPRSNAPNHLVRRIRDDHAARRV